MSSSLSLKPLSMPESSSSFGEKEVPYYTRSSSDAPEDDFDIPGNDLWAVEFPETEENALFCLELREEDRKADIERLFK